MKYTSFSEILYRIVRDYGLDDINEGDIVEYIAEALVSIGLHGIAQKKFSIAKVYNYAADLPADLLEILQIVKIDGLSVRCLCDENTDTAYIVTHTKNIKQVNGCSQIVQQCQDIIFIRDSLPKEIEFTPVRKNSSTLTYECCNEIGTNKGYVYDEGINQIRLSFSDGLIGIGYYGIAMDDKGLPIVPDIESVKEAVSKYVLYKYFQRKFYTSDSKGVQVKFQKAEYDWNEAAKRARNEVMMPSIDDMQNMYENSIDPFKRERYYQYFKTTYKPVVEKRNVKR